jgi:cardiolipin synthase
MAVVFVPLLGALFFLLVGSGRLPQHRRDKQRFVTEAIAARSEGGLDKISHRDEWPPWLASVTRLNRNLGALPMIGGNTATLGDGYVQSIQSMIDDIDAATAYVHVEFFILVHDETTAPFFDALARACRRGVTVRVLSDHFASSATRTAERPSRCCGRWAPSTDPCCRSSPSVATGAGPICATTASSSSSTDASGTPGSLNMIIDRYHKKSTVGSADQGGRNRVRRRAPAGWTSSCSSPRQ